MPSSHKSSHPLPFSPSQIVRLVSRPRPRFAAAALLPNPELDEIYLQTMRRAGFRAGEELQKAILKMDLNTVFGAFRVDRDGFQILNKMLMFQWQDGKKVILWPDELAQGKPRFPTLPWREPS